MQVDEQQPASSFCKGDICPWWLRAEQAMKFWFVGFILGLRNRGIKSFGNLGGFWIDSSYRNSVIADEVFSVIWTTWEVMDTCPCVELSLDLTTVKRLARVTESCVQLVDCC